MSFEANVCQAKSWCKVGAVSRDSDGWPQEDKGNDTKIGERHWLQNGAVYRCRVTVESFYRKLNCRGSTPTTALTLERERVLSLHRVEYDVRH